MESPLKVYEVIQPLVKKDISDAFTVKEKQTETDSQYQLTRIQSHAHTGIDSVPIEFSHLSNRVLTVYWTIPGAQAATATNYGTFFTAPYACTVIAMTEVHETAGTNAGAVTLQLERLQGTDAPGAGDEILVTAFNLKATANTVQEGVITPVRTSGISAANLSVGDRLCLKDAGTLTALSNVSVVVLIQY